MADPVEMCAECVRSGYIGHLHCPRCGCTWDYECDYGGWHEPKHYADGCYVGCRNSTCTWKPPSETEREGKRLAFRLDSIMTALTDTDEGFRRDKRLMERKWNIDLGPTRISSGEPAKDS